MDIDENWNANVYYLIAFTVTSVVLLIVVKVMGMNACSIVQRSETLAIWIVKGSLLL
jgi:hypothetical protein